MIVNSNPAVFFLVIHVVDTDVVVKAVKAAINSDEDSILG